MTGHPPSGGAPVIECGDCAGLTFTVRPCRCVRGGNQLLIDADAYADGEAYRDCRICRGGGGEVRACFSCGQQGRRRAQLVYTVANLDTGAVASASVVPGSLPVGPAPGGGWQLPLGPLVRELADTVGAAGVVDIVSPGRPLEYLDIRLPVGWRLEPPAPSRRELEAQAIAEYDTLPWRLFLGRTAPPPARDTAAQLGRLLAVADLLCLDLVIEARRHPWGVGWDIRYELPDSGVPPAARRSHETLTEAVQATSVIDALDGLTERGLTAGAYQVNPTRIGAPQPPPLDLDQVDQLDWRIRRDLPATCPGAQAVWRDGRWWHLRLSPGPSVESLHERDTGQIAYRRTRMLRRVEEPPAPAWRGELIPHSPCPDCTPNSRLRRCTCTLTSGGMADPDCPDCAGAGMASSWLACHTCRGSHRLHHAAVVTITDLHTGAIHQLWQPEPGEPATLIGTQPGGKPIFQIAERYRLGRWSRLFGVRPQDLTELDSGHEIGQDLRDGIHTLPDTETDPVIEYVRAAAAGRPGARLLVLAARPDTPPLADLIRLAYGLALETTVTVQDHRQHDTDPRRLHGWRWQVEIIPPGRSIDRLNPPYQPTVEAAIAYCLEHLENTLCTAVPPNPGELIDAPQAAPSAYADPTPQLQRLAAHYPGQAITVHFAPNGCHIWLHEHDTVLPLARAATLTDAITALRL